jgi:hypothetical protein
MMKIEPACRSTLAPRSGERVARAKRGPGEGLCSGHPVLGEPLIRPAARREGRSRQIDAHKSEKNGQGRQLILCTGAPERQLSASPQMTKPCFS